MWRKLMQEATGSLTRRDLGDPWQDTLQVLYCSRFQLLLRLFALTWRMDPWQDGIHAFF